MTRSDRSPHPATRSAPRRPLAGRWFGVPAAVWAAVVLVIVLAWLAQVLTARQGMAEQAGQRNQQAADQMAARLGRDLPSRGESQARIDWLSAVGQIEEVRWSDASGEVLARFDAAAPAASVPDWFVRLSPIEVAQGLAVLPLDGRPSELRVRLSLEPVWQVQWACAWQLALALAALGALAIGAVALARTVLQRAVGQLIVQLRAVRGGDAAAVTLAEDDVLHPLADAVRRFAEQRAALLAAHAEQMEALRRHAHVDALTGLPNRRAFMAQLSELLVDSAGAGGVGLVLLRVRDLYGLNLRQGHGRTDEMLQALADLLRGYPQQVAGCALGRLNGSDFALLLPVAGQALGSAQSLLAALRPLLGPLDSAAGVAIGAVELQRSTPASDALALADEALARAEIGGRFALEATGQAARASVGGETNWPVRIRRALDDGRIRLAEHPLRTADGRLLLLDCPLHLQLDPEGPFEPASRWFALAARTRLVADVDERAVEVALRAIGDDGIARCVNVSAASLATPGFIERVARLLGKRPSSAFRLWIDLAEATARDHPDLVREASARWRVTGAMLALEHAGDIIARKPQLLDLGLDCVRIDSRFVDGVSRPGGENARRYLRALVHLVQGVGLQITAEGVRSADDLALLWLLGFDAATGPVVVGEGAEVDLPLELEAWTPPAARRVAVEDDCLVTD